MNTRHLIEIPCQPANPVDYLACCGLADLVARADSTALSYWITAPPIRLVIETEIRESDWVHLFCETFCDVKKWNFVRSASGNELALVEVLFAPKDRPPFRVALDWWYETLSATGDLSKKSAWKMYAGNQSTAGLVFGVPEPPKKTFGMIYAASLLQSAVLSTGILRAFFTEHIPMTGRFGFDPRSTRDALNVGFSPNDLGQPVMTYPFSEMLSSFGLASFFPSRTGIPGELDSTRGWVNRGEERSAFSYHLWRDPLPVALARLAAARGGNSEAPALLSVRNNRKHYANLTNAKPSDIQNYE